MVENTPEYCVRAPKTARAFFNMSPNAGIRPPDIFPNAGNPQVLHLTFFQFATEYAQTSFDTFPTRQNVWGIAQLFLSHIVDTSIQMSCLTFRGLPNVQKCLRISLDMSELSLPGIKCPRPLLALSLLGNKCRWRSVGRCDVLDRWTRPTVQLTWFQGRLA